MKSTKRLIQATFVVLALAAACAQYASAALVLKPGDRVVIYGDSITEQRLYSRYMQQYIYCRYPELKVKFFNAGWSGDRAPGALKRLERDVLYLKPTVVTLFFGMNDGEYTTLRSDIVATYRQNMEKIIQALQAKKVKVVVYTPGCVDYDQQKRLGDVSYNETLDALGKAALELAKKYGCPSADVIHTMLKFQAARKALDPKFTMIPDSVHPNPQGHLVVAQAMLGGLGAEPMPAIGSIDILTGTGSGLKVISKDAGKIVLETTKPLLAPFWFAEDCGVTMRDSGFLQTAGQRISIRGLTGLYTLSIDGEKAGQFTADQLAAGVPVPGGYSSRGKMIQDTTAYKEDLYFNTWRTMRLGFPDLPGLKNCVNSALGLDSALDESIWALAAPRKATITLERVP